jgi:hypothetical protein
MDTRNESAKLRASRFSSHNFIAFHSRGRPGGRSLVLFATHCCQNKNPPDASAPTDFLLELFIENLKLLSKT